MSSLMFGVAAFQYDEVPEGAGAIALIGGLLALALCVFFIAVFWKIYSKAGQPGWACIIPFYNIWVFVKILGKPPLWFVLMLIPLVNIIMCFIVPFVLAEKFGKGTGFALGLLLLWPIFYPILAFGSAQYQG